MTLPTSGTLSLDAINTEYNLGRNLGAYRGVRWYKDDNSRGYFDNNSSGNGPPTDISEFYGTRKTIPVTPQTINPASTGYRTIGFYNTMTFNLASGTTGSPSGTGSSWTGIGLTWVELGAAGGGPPGSSSITWGTTTLGSAQTDNATATLIFDADNNVVRFNGSVVSGVTPPLLGTQIYIQVGAPGAGGVAPSGTRTTGATGANGNPGSIWFQIA